jgi:hypothetical protein
MERPVAMLAVLVVVAAHAHPHNLFIRSAFSRDGSLKSCGNTATTGWPAGNRSRRSSGTSSPGPPRGGSGQSSPQRTRSGHRGAHTCGFTREGSNFSENQIGGRNSR